MTRCEIGKFVTKDKFNRVYLKGLIESETVVVKVSAKTLQEHSKVNQAFICKHKLTQG